MDSSRRRCVSHISMGCIASRRVTTAHSTAPLSRMRAGRHTSVISKIVWKKRTPSRSTCSLDSPIRSSYFMGISTMRIRSSMRTRALIAGVKCSPSGSGYSLSRDSRRMTRMPLAVSVTMRLLRMLRMAA